MKKLVRNLLIFVCVVVLIDVCYGFVCGYLQDNAKFGGTAKRMYVAKKSTEDIMMFGSSRMMHHYRLCPVCKLLPTGDVGSYQHGKRTYAADKGQTMH